jgi:hypothetical protein
MSSPSDLPPSKSVSEVGKGTIFEVACWRRLAESARDDDLAGSGSGSPGALVDRCAWAGPGLDWRQGVNRRNAARQAATWKLVPASGRSDGSRP